MNEKKRSGLASIFFVAMMLGVFFCVMFPSGQTPKQKWQGEVTAIYKLLGPSLSEIPAAMSSDIYKSGTGSSLTHSTFVFRTVKKLRLGNGEENLVMVGMNFSITYLPYFSD